MIQRLIILLMLWTLSITPAVAQTVFEDDFTRPDSPKVGNGWVEKFEGTIPRLISSTSIFPGYIELYHGTLSFSYLAPKYREQLNFRPYIYIQTNDRTKQIQSFKLDVLPHKDERIMHEIGLIDITNGIQTNTVKNVTFGTPTFGVTLLLRKTSSLFKNSDISVIKYNKGIRNEIKTFHLPFQFNYGKSYAVEMEIIGSSTVHVSVSDGTTTFERTVDVPPIDFPLNTFAIMDIQGGVSYNSAGTNEVYRLRFDNIRISDGTSNIDPLALKYEPILRLHPDETYLPMNTDAYVRHAALWDDRGILPDTLLYSQGEVTLDTLATTTPTRQWYLQFTDGEKKKHIDPKKIKNEYLALKKTPLHNISEYIRRMTDFFVDDRGAKQWYTVLQYWYFYAFNDWKEHGGFNNHEGDWESVMLFFKGKQPSGDPSYVAYSAHHTNGNSTILGSARRSWKAPDTVINDTHANSFVALGSHANYPNNGRNGTHFAGTANDRTGTNGVTITPNSWQYREMISEDKPGWIAHYAGRWGADTADITGGGSGPAGPKFISVGGTERFLHPVKWAGLDKIGTRTATPRESRDFSFPRQNISVVFSQALDAGTEITVDLHDELISFGENVINRTIALLNHFWDITADIENGSFSAEVTITYDPKEIAKLRIDPEQLTAYHYNETRNTWETIASTVDTHNNSVTFTTSHFSRFALGVPRWSPVGTSTVSQLVVPGGVVTAGHTESATIILQSRTELSLPFGARLVAQPSARAVLADRDGTTNAGRPFLLVPPVSLSCRFTGTVNDLPPRLPRGVVAQLLARPLSGAQCEQLADEIPDIEPHLSYFLPAYTPLRIPFTYQPNTSGVATPHTPPLTFTLERANIAP